MKNFAKKLSELALMNVKKDEEKNAFIDKVSYESDKYIKFVFDECGKKPPMVMVEQIL